MNIALKEARETNYWLRLMRDSQMISVSGVENMLEESDNLRNILAAIVKPSKERK
jgi:four helix bundle protein